MDDVTVARLALLITKIFTNLKLIKEYKFGIFDRKSNYISFTSYLMDSIKESETSSNNTIATMRIPKILNFKNLYEKFGINKNDIGKRFYYGIDLNMDRYKKNGIEIKMAMRPLEKDVAIDLYCRKDQFLKLKLIGW